jgi:hypothetical protein
MPASAGVDNFNLYSTVVAVKGKGEDDVMSDPSEIPIT